MADRSVPGALTERQQAVLDLLRQGYTNREIGNELGITEDGVKAHLSRLFLRFGVSNRVELLAAANFDPRRDRALSSRASLGALRAIAGRANARTLDREASSAPLDLRIAAVRDALAAVDGALDIVGELPPETTGPVVAAVRKRLAEALDALAALQSEGVPVRSA